MGEFLVIEQRLHELTHHNGRLRVCDFDSRFWKKKKTRFKQRTGIRLQNLWKLMSVSKESKHTHGGCVSSPAGCGQRVLAPTYLLLRKYLFLKVDGLATRYIVKCRSLHWLLKDCPRFNRFSDPEKWCLQHLIFQRWVRPFLETWWTLTFFPRFWSGQIVHWIVRSNF